MAGKIFISYRREDAKAEARSMYQWLQGSFRGLVFMDVDTIQKGRDFLKVLDEHLAQCAVMLVVMGPRWADSNAVQRLQDENDLVRLEVAAALQRDIPVIPVLVDGAKMPAASVLPEDLKPLVRRHGAIITHENFARDMGGLVDDLRSAFGSPRRWRFRVPQLGVLVFFAAVTAVALGYVALMHSDATITISVSRMQPNETRSISTPPEAQKRPPKALTLAEERALKAKDTFKECADCPEMVVVPAGTFTMGSPLGEEGRVENEGPTRTVTIARPFAVGKFEVTFAEWDACVTAGFCTIKPDDRGWGRGKRPVINISWDDVTKEYLPWLSRKAGKTYRLLTEAEWEFAARAGTTTPFSTGTTITTQQANFNGEFRYGGGAKGINRQTSLDVGTFAPNDFGLHDMHGNVMEWIADCFVPTYAGSPADGTALTSPDCKRHVVRGGSWLNSPIVLRSAFRGSFSVDRASFIGFRVARSLSQ